MDIFVENQLHTFGTFIPLICFVSLALDHDVVDANQVRVTICRFFRSDTWPRERLFPLHFNLASLFFSTLLMLECFYGTVDSTINPKLFDLSLCVYLSQNLFLILLRSLVGNESAIAISILSILYPGYNVSTRKIRQNVER